VVLGVVGLIGLSAVVSLAARQGSNSSASGGHPQPGPPTQPTAATTTDAPPTSVTSAASVPSTTARIPPRPQKVSRLGDNPIFAGVGLPAVRCTLPRVSADLAVQTAFYQAAVDCLNRAWLPQLAAAGLPADPPALAVPTGPYPTACGNKSPTDNANYCEGVIYMPPRYFSEVERVTTNQPAVFLGVLAHEYGHHVQELAGVMDAAWAQRYEDGLGSPAGLEVSRRNELGATCFGGMFLASVTGHGSVTQDLLDQIARDQARRGDIPGSGLPRDHGSMQNNGAWFITGLRHNRTSACNTWLAPPQSVA
jgi:predicted metalloprotease